MREPAILTAAWLSGGAALTYEVCWSRALVVPLGNSADAAALVLSGFMLGLSAGAWLGGKLARRADSPLRPYAVLELLLGLFALAAPLLFERLTGWHAAVRYPIAMLLVAVPCLPMGASLPLLARALGPGGARELGVLYGANTAGAAICAILTGFFGIASLGVRGCSELGAVASFAAAGLALAAARRAPAPVPARASAAGNRAALASAFVSGFAMLACELLWARVLTFVFGHETYAFAALLAVVLVGLALGGLLHRLVAGWDQERLLGVLLGLFSVAVLLSFWAAAALVVRWGRDPFGLDAASALATSVRLELYRELLYTPILVGAPAVLSGMLYPAACSRYGGPDADAGGKLAAVGIANGIGSAAGALVAAFGLVAWIGIQLAFVALATLSAVVAMAVSRRALGLVAVAVVVWSMPRELPRQLLLEAVGPRHQTLLHYEEARTGTVSVVENQINGERQLVLNAVNEVTTRLVHDQSFKLLGHLGLLLHPRPRQVVMICLGAGLSAGAAATHPIDRLDVVDLSAAVARAARHFTPENRGVLDDPRFRLHVDDGRRYLLDAPARYDVAIVDSTHPKAVDSWILYTREFYQLLRARLADGGIAVQWVPLHGLSEREFKILVRTFQAAFPEATLWASAGYETYGTVAYAKLLGVRGGRLVVDADALARRLAEPEIHADLAPFGMASVDEILDSYVAGPEAIRAWTEGLPVQTDDRPLVPYTTEYSRGRRMLPELLLGVREPAPGAAREAAGLVLAGRLQRAAELYPKGEKVRRFVAQARTTRGYYLALAARYPDDSTRLFEAATQLATLGSPSEARPVFERALALQRNDFRARLNSALLLRSLGDPRGAVERLTRLRDEQPRSALVHFNLGATVLADGDAGVAAGHLREALAWDPAHLGARLALSEAYLASRAPDRAEAELERVLRENPWVAEAHDLLGLVAEQRGRHGEAAEHHGRAVQLQPYEPTWHYHLGVALQHGGELVRAAAEYQSALRIEPRHAAAWHGLGLVHAARGDFDQAADAQVRALEAEPSYAEAAHELGLALRALGRGDDAIQAFCLALRLDPGRRPSAQQLAELGSRAEACSR